MFWNRRVFELGQSVCGDPKNYMTSLHDHQNDILDYKLNVWIILTTLDPYIYI